MTNRLKQAAWAALALSASLGFNAAHAEGHYVAGVEGLQGATVPTDAGLYYLGYLAHYDINSLRDAQGNKIAGTGSVTALANRLVWMTGHKVLGADYGVETIIPVLHQDFKFARDSEAGIGDVYVGPVVLGWHGARWDAVAAAGVWLDNASTKGGPAAVGKGYKSWMLTAGGTYYFDAAKNWSGSALTRFERNTTNGNGLRHGNQVTMEWGVGKRFGVMQAGVVGYSQWQVSDDKGVGASSNKNQVHALGAEFNYALPAHKTNLKVAAYKEFKSEDGPKGNLLRLSLVKAF